MKVKVLRDWKYIIVSTKKVKKTDLFINNVNTEQILKENIKEIDKQINNELDNMSKNELKDMYEELTGKKAFNWWDRNELIKKILELK